MKYVQFLLVFLITIGLIYALEVIRIPVGESPPPPLGKFLNPFSGFWQNAESKEISYDAEVSLEGLKDEVQVYYDDRRVPHIFAKNDEDLYFMQGYVTARDRLWQMEMITHFASGRVSEIIGERTLEVDRLNRRKGIPFGAKNAISQIDTDPVAKTTLESYTAGVNAYISSLSQAELPVEYKLLDYQPEAWTPYKTAVLLKYMSNNLAGGENDYTYTQALKVFGRETFDLIYRDYPAGIDPIIPEGTPYDFDSIALDTPQYNIPEGITQYDFQNDYVEGIGSNNWAISGNRTATGSPILCNDPHLNLSLPSIWYEMQLVSPSCNVYGVTLPGSPCVIIGFNQNIAWGITNAGRDVKDYYTIKYKGESRTEYMHDGEWKKTTVTYDTIKMRGKTPFIDTLVFTHFGPVMYDRGYKIGENSTPLACRWKAHDASNELQAFYKMNRAKNHADYIAALEYYECPGQNFVFAAKDGDIAIKQQGKFPLRWTEQGKFIMDGTTSDYEWQGYIPSEQNPQVKNPPRGFVSSANQHPTDTTYPYYYHAPGFEYNRSRRINETLRADSNITIEDVKKLHFDNFNYTAADIMPFLLSKLDKTNLSDTEQKALDLLESWDYKHDPEKEAPSVYQAMWDTLEVLLWDELAFNKPGELKKPATYVTTDFLINHGNHPLIDDQRTPEKEDVTILANKAFKLGVANLVRLTDAKDIDWTWGQCRELDITHLGRIPQFSAKQVITGGHKSIVNANSPRNGVSWRMIISLEDEVKAWGVYPGGESGNPGSHYYDNQIQYWAEGDYYELIFMKNSDDQENIQFSQTFKKK